MKNGKRPYVSKVKGCYQCSQRRIHCDRGEPNCSKCVSRGLQCSGLGIRYRFNDDVRSKVANKKHKSQANQHDMEFGTRTNASSNVEVSSQQNNSYIAWTHQTPFDVNDDFEMWSTSDTVHANDVWNSYQSTANGDSNIDLSSVSSKNSKWAAKADWEITRSYMALDDNLEPWKRHLLLHFSHDVAPEMVVIDDKCNGWRHLILPMARLDNLVMDAVLSAAAFHFFANFDNQTYNPDAIYAKAIRRLQERQDLATQDTESKQAVLLALLVLLSTVMINGSTDFPTIYNLLEFAVRASGSEEELIQGDLGVFVVRQIRKYRGYAAPFLSKDSGYARLRLTPLYGRDAVDGWECFKNSYQSHPEFSQSLSTIFELGRQACNIYSTRVLAGPDGPPLTEMVEEFKTTLKAYPPGSPGEHVLVWPTFLVAAESVLPEHQEFFTNALLRHYRRNGFTNITLALESLSRIWSGKPRQDWTQYLPELRVFIV